MGLVVNLETADCFGHCCRVPQLCNNCNSSSFRNSCWLSRCFYNSRYTAACCPASSSGCLCMPCSLQSGTAGSDWRQLVIVKQEAARDLCWQLDHRCCGRHYAARLVQWRSCTSGPRSCSQPTCHQCCFGSIRCDYSLCFHLCTQPRQVSRVWSSAQVRLLHLHVVTDSCSCERSWSFSQDIL